MSLFERLKTERRVSFVNYKVEMATKSDNERALGGLSIITLAK